MSRMIVLLSVVIVLFAVAAGGSWYLQNQQAKDPELSRADEKSGKGGAAASGGKDKTSGEASLSRPVIRTAATPPETERLAQLAAAVQQQQESLKAREKLVAGREKQMDIHHDQIKLEQKKLEGLRKDIQ